MATCPKCGAEVNKDDQFCGSCGASLTTEAERPTERRQYPRESDVCFESERRADHMSLVSFGIFLLIVGTIFATNRNLVPDFQTWIETVTNAGVFSRPPLGLINSAALFFGLLGASNFLVAGVRFMTQKNARKVWSDTLTGVGLVIFSYLIHLYGNETLRGLSVLAIEAVVIGLLVIVYAAMCYLFSK